MAAEGDLVWSLCRLVRVIDGGKGPAIPFQNTTAEENADLLVKSGKRTNWLGKLDPSRVHGIWGLDF